MKGTMTRKAGRGGQCLLAGLLRCARCGRMLHVMYGRRGYARYECRQANRAEAAPRCIGFSARRPDETVSAEILTVVQGSALQAAIEAGDLAEQHHHDQHRALALELEQAHYQAALAARRYEAVDPDNRLVAAELEARWNGALARVAELEGRLTAQGNVAPRFVHVDRDTLESLATDLRSVWDAPSSEMRLKQRIARLLIHEIIANTAEDHARDRLAHPLGGRPTLRGADATTDGGRSPPPDGPGRRGRRAAHGGRLAGSRHRRQPQPAAPAHRSRQHVDGLARQLAATTAAPRRLRRDPRDAPAHAEPSRRSARRRVMGGSRAHQVWPPRGDPGAAVCPLADRS